MKKPDLEDEKYRRQGNGFTYQSEVPYNQDMDKYIYHLEKENSLLKEGYKQVSDFMDNNLKPNKK